MYMWFCSAVLLTLFMMFLDREKTDAPKLLEIEVTFDGFDFLDECLGRYVERDLFDEIVVATDQ